LSAVVQICKKEEKR